MAKKDEVPWWVVLLGGVAAASIVIAAANQATAVACPRCGQPVVPKAATCPHCRVTLIWKT